MEHIDNARAELMSALSHLREPNHRWTSRMRSAVRSVGDAARALGDANESIAAAALMVERARDAASDRERLAALDAALWHLFDVSEADDRSER